MFQVTLTTCVNSFVRCVCGGGVQVSVEILDVNDNPPRFRDSEIQLAVIEAAQVGSAYILPTATDDDGPDLGVQRYELDSAVDKFVLDVGTKLDGTAEVCHHAGPVRSGSGRGVMCP